MTSAHMLCEASLVFENTKARRNWAGVVHRGVKDNERRSAGGSQAATESKYIYPQRGCLGIDLIR